MLVPQVVGYKLTGKLREGATATDLVLTVTQALRKLGVVGKFVEFYGPGIAELPLADRATIGNMAPEYGATCGIFPVDAETLRYLRLTGRSEEQIALVEAYYKEQGLFHTAGTPEAEYTQTLELDLATVEPSVAGPKRPQDRVLLKDAAASFAQQLPTLLAPTAKPLGSRTAAAWQRAIRHRHRRRCRRERRAISLGPNPRHHNGERALQRRSRSLSRPRLGRHRRHHQLHQHLEPLRDDRRRPAREKSRRKRPHRSAVGQDLARSRLARRHRLLPEGRPAALSRKAALQRGRLRLHHLHRQLRPAACRRDQEHRRARPRRRQRALGQSQLRGPRQRRRARQLPHVVRRSSSPTRSPAASATTSTPIRSAKTNPASPSTSKTSGPRKPKSPRPSSSASTARASAANTPPSPRATPAGRASASPSATSTSGSPTPPTSARRPTSTA